MFQAKIQPRHFVWFLIVALCATAASCVYSMLIWGNATKLQRAAFRGDIEGIRRACSSQALPADTKTNVPFDSLRRDMTTVLWAVEGNQPDSIRELASFGFDINACGSEGFSPVTWAIFRRHDLALGALIHAGADLGPDARGRVPLLYALEGRRFSSALHLIGAGADLYTSDANGNTVLSLILGMFGGSEAEALVEALLLAGFDPQTRIAPSLQDERSLVEYAVTHLDTRLVDQVLDRATIGASEAEHLLMLGRKRGSEMETLIRRYIR